MRINPNFESNSGVEFYEINTADIEPSIVTLGVTFSIDGIGHALAQKKDAGWNVQPGAFTMFGGRVKDSEMPDNAILREAKDELGHEFIKFATSTSDIKPISDVRSPLEIGGQVTHLRLFELQLGDFLYSEWLDEQKKISIGEGIGCIAVTLDELNGQLGSLFVPHDRDMLRYILTK